MCDDVELFTDETRAKKLDSLHFLRQQANREGSEPCRSLADFIAPKATGLRDHIGAFAVTTGIGLKELTDRYRAEHDDYNAIMAEALADRLAEAFAECLHKRVRDEWGYGREENLSQRGADPRRSIAAFVLRRDILRVLITRRKERSGGCWMLKQDGHPDNRVVCDVAGIERERALLCAS